MGIWAGYFGLGVHHTKGEPATQSNGQRRL